jgi:hypothetical protein
VETDAIFLDEDPRAKADPVDTVGLKYRRVAQRLERPD